jgi:hypothetical protein
MADVKSCLCGWIWTSAREQARGRNNSSKWLLFKRHIDIPFAPRAGSAFRFWTASGDALVLRAEDAYFDVRDGYFLVVLEDLLLPDVSEWRSLEAARRALRKLGFWVDSDVYDAGKDAARAARQPATRKAGFTPCIECGRKTRAPSGCCRNCSSAGRRKQHEQPFHVGLSPDGDIEVIDVEDEEDVEDARNTDQEDNDDDE